MEIMGGYVECGLWTWKLMRTIGGIEEKILYYDERRE
jgi:hypothetical protein